MEDEVMIAIQPEQPIAAVEQVHLATQWRRHAAKNLARFAVPRYLRIVEQLPKTLTGKIRKIELREQGVTQNTIDFQIEDKNTQ